MKNKINGQLKTVKLPKTGTRANVVKTGKTKLPKLPEQITIDEIDLIRMYSGSHGVLGIGYLNSIDLIIKFRIETLSQLDDVPVVDVEKISLSESVCWLERMNIMDRELGLNVTPFDDGYERWLREIAKELPSRC